MVVQKMAAHPDDGETTEKAQPSRRMYQGITVEKLNAEWEKIVCELKLRGIMVTHHRNALEGALSIRYYNLLF